MIDKQTLKLRCSEAIDQNREAILAFADDIYRHPEMGYHEFRSTEKMKEVFQQLGLAVEDGIAYTGCSAKAGREDGPVVAIMGELDSLNCPDHPDCDANGNVHSCGHHAQLAYLYGCAVGLVQSGVLPSLDGAVKFIAIPAEEYVDADYRSGLVAQGKIKYYGGKQEYLLRGGMDDVDMVLQSHLINTQSKDIVCCLDTDCDGFIGKSVRFIGRAAHAGFAPSEGINALNMAQLALNGIHTLRETFRDEDKVRVSAIITKCGEMVNTVPAEAEMQLMVRAASLDAMLDSSRKVDRALKAGALAIGGKVEIQNQIGYLPLHSSRELTAVYKENVKNYLGCTDSAFIPQYVSAGSTDLGDISHIVPCMHIWTGGISGALHASDFKVTDQEAAFILPAKMMAMTVIDLLFDKAGCAKAVMDAFHPVFTKEEYLAFLREHSGLDFFDGSTL